MAASINAATLALIHAGVPIYDYVVAVSVVHLANTPLLDMNRMEETAARSSAPQITLASFGRTPSQTLFLNQESRCPLDKLDSMTQVAREGISKIFSIFDDQVILPYVKEANRLRAIRLSSSYMQ